MSNAISTGGGILLLAVLFVDLLLTVFHPQGHGGPLHRRLNRLFWAALRLLARGVGRPAKDRFLALCGPLIAVTSVGTWGLWLILSFTLIYHPQRVSLLPTPEGDVSWLDVFYYSGYVASTLGLGDIVPASPVLRLLTVVEAMSGFALFAVATTYLLAVYQYVAKEQILAMELASVLGNGTSRLAPDGDGPRDDPASFAAWAGPVARRMLEVVQAHGQYPVLHYFRPVENVRSLVIQVGRLLDRLEEASSDTGGAGQLRWAVRRYLLELHSGCLPASRRHDSHHHKPPLAVGKELRSLHARLLGYLAYADPRIAPQRPHPESSAGQHHSPQTPNAEIRRTSERKENR